MAIFYRLLIRIQKLELQAWQWAMLCTYLVVLNIVIGTVIFLLMDDSLDNVLDDLLNMPTMLTQQGDQTTNQAIATRRPTFTPTLVKVVAQLEPTVTNTPVVNVATTTPHIQYAPQVIKAKSATATPLPTKPLQRLVNASQRDTLSQDDMRKLAEGQILPSVLIDEKSEILIESRSDNTQVMAGLVATATPQPTRTPSSTSTVTVTSKPTKTALATKTTVPTSTATTTALAATDTATQIATVTAKPTQTSSPTSTPLPTPTASPTVTFTRTSQPTQTATSTPTIKPTETAHVTDTPVPTATLKVIQAAVQAAAIKFEPRPIQSEVLALNQIGLRWPQRDSEVKEVRSYRVFSDMGSGYGVFILQADLDTTEFVHVGLQSSKQYVYRIDDYQLGQNRILGFETVTLPELKPAIGLSTPLTALTLPSVATEVIPAPTPLPPDTLLLGLVSDASFTDQFDVFHVVGEMRNDTNLDAGKITAIVTFYDETGQLLAEMEGHGLIDTLAPGQRTPFKVSMPNSAKIKDYSVKTLGRPVRARLEPELDIVQSETYRDRVGFLHVIGRIENHSSETAQQVKVVVTLYNDDGSMINTNFDYPEISALDPGEQANFDVEFTYFPHSFNYQIAVTSK